MATNMSILEQLKNGSAHFEVVSCPVPSISLPNSFQFHFNPITATNISNHRFFARISPPSSSIGATSSSVKKAEKHYSVCKVTGDGRCMFRALVKGMAMNEGATLTPRQERDGADKLRTAVKEVICDNAEEQRHFQEAIIAITIDEPLRRYCQRIGRPDFWGGEAELLVLSKLCCQPIVVYIPSHEHRNGSFGSGFIPIAEYGAEYSKGSGKKKQGKVVRLLYSRGNHYDLLV